MVSIWMLFNLNKITKAIWSPLMILDHGKKIFQIYKHIVMCCFTPSLNSWGKSLHKFTFTCTFKNFAFNLNLIVVYIYIYIYTHAINVYLSFLIWHIEFLHVISDALCAITGLRTIIFRIMRGTVIVKFLDFKTF